MPTPSANLLQQRGGGGGGGRPAAESRCLTADQLCAPGRDAAAGQATAAPKPPPSLAAARAMRAEQRALPAAGSQV